MREKLKKVCICCTGFFISYNNLWGINPLAVAFFAAAYMEKVYRWLLFSLTMLGMSFVMPTEQIVRYGVPMVVMMVIVDLIERGHRVCKRWVGYSFMGMGMLLMTVVKRLFVPTDGTILIQGALESVFVVSASFLLGGLIRLILRYEFKRPFRENKKEELLLQGPGKDRLLAYAESFRSLSRNFSKFPNPELANVSSSQEQGILQGAVDDSWTRKERLWKNRLIENKLVAAGQLSEMAQIITEVAEDIYDVVDVGEQMEDRIKKHLKNEGITAKNILMIEKKDKRLEIYMTVKVHRGNSVSTKEIGRIISGVCSKDMVAAYESKTVIYKDYTTIFLEEDANFRILTGIARLPKEDEEVSGDNYAFTNIGNGRMILSLSDGMGSGVKAYRESEQVIELFEQFTETGFSKEVAVQMISGAMISRTDEQSVLSLDVSDIDLYDGVCDFLKIGSASSFIKRDSWVEIVQSSSLPLGVFHKPDFDTTAKKLYDEDFIIMVTDGVVDRIPGESPEEVLAEIIKQIKTSNPKEMAKKILAKIMSMRNEPVSDDMTILVAGIWKK